MGAESWEKIKTDDFFQSFAWSGAKKQGGCWGQARGRERYGCSMREITSSVYLLIRMIKQRRKHWCWREGGFPEWYSGQGEKRWDRGTAMGLALDRSRDGWVWGKKQEADVGADTGGWSMWSSLRRFPSDCLHFLRKIGNDGHRF